jgi:hypothetical protein
MSTRLAPGFFFNTLPAAFSAGRSTTPARAGTGSGPRTVRAVVAPSCSS